MQGAATCRVLTQHRPAHGRLSPQTHDHSPLKFADTTDPPPSPGPGTSTRGSGIHVRTDPPTDPLTDPPTDPFAHTTGVTALSAQQRSWARRARPARPAVVGVSGPGGERGRRDWRLGSS